MPKIILNKTETVNKNISYYVRNIKFNKELYCVDREL